MARRPPLALFIALVMAALTPTPTVQATMESSPRSSTTLSAPAEFDSLTVTFAYATTVGESLSEDRQTRSIEIPANIDPITALTAWENTVGVLAVIPDVPVNTTLVPSDPRYSEQWDLGVPTPTATNGGAANVSPVWATATGSGAIVAVLDTGGIAHPDLIDAQPSGWGIDMVSDSWRANDGDGRDTNPTDPGDDCGSGSSWHGTHVAGTIAAQHNEIGVAGIAPDARLMHVRVLGKCGGSFDDVIDGIRWAAGLPTSLGGSTWGSQGLPANANPADVINLSLGGGTPCFDTLQTAISEARAAGTIVVAAAGNSNVDAATFAPANCDDVITVGSVGKRGGRAWYSNYGATVEIAAPGGDTSRDSGILSTIGLGTTTLTGYGYANYQGTSMAAPHVAGVVALLVGKHPYMPASAVETALFASTRPFPEDGERPCVTTSTAPTGLQRRCGAGLLDAALALEFVAPTITITAPIELEVDQAVELSASSGSAGSITLALDPASAGACSLIGNTITGQTIGNCIVTASLPASAEAVAGFGRSIIAVRGLAQSISFGVGTELFAAPIRFGEHPTLTATASSGLPVSFQGLNSTCGIHYDTTSGTPVPKLGYGSLGNCTIAASQGGNSRFRPAETVQRSVVIVRGIQSISTAGIGDRFVSDGAQGLPALSSNGLPLTWASLTEAICSVSITSGGPVLQPIAAGTCTVRGEQAGNENYESTSATYSMLISKRMQAPLSLNLPNRAFRVGERTRFSWSGGSTVNPVVARSATPSVCTVKYGYVTFIRAGTCTLTAAKVGTTEFYDAASSARRTVFVRAKSIAAPTIRRVATTYYGTPGRWSLGSPRATLSYQWFSCTSGYSGCRAVAGGTSLALRITPGLSRRYVKLRVRATHFNQQWTSVDRWSAPLLVPLK
jgi:subtilisin family serine protease